ncbi:LysR family transcriptional regulator [Gymnodinialimonas sp. 2305UL16-5]|uniref:LysR family transcriptional regulator n=1 Tax=Gymnodinialimonas mytili TaxID=3126503 RepID=UPI0030A8A20A
MRHLRVYRSIQAIVEAGSIRKAAETLAISPSALNRSIQSFEAELGTEIFERVAGGVRLSVPGELLLRPIIEHLAQFDDFQGLVSEMKGGRAGTLRLSVSGDLWPGFASGVVDTFRDAHPGVALQITADEGIAPLMARQVDLALVTLPATDDETDVLMSGRAAITGWVAADHPKAGGALSLADLADHCVVVPGPGSGLRQSLDVMLRRTGVQPGAVAIMPGMPMTLRQGDLAFSLSDQVPRPANLIRSVDIAALRLPDVQITLVARHGGYRPRAVDQFMVYLGRALDAFAQPRAASIR